MTRLTDGLLPLDGDALAQARTHLDTLTKPLGSLGRLEDLAAQVIAICGGLPGLPLKKAVYVFAADHGIVDEGVSAYPRAVTQQMVLNFLAGGAAINVLAKLHGVAMHVVDMGVDADFAGASGLENRKIARGTVNMLHEAAMSDAQLAEALEAGAACVKLAVQSGVTMLAMGEMGIGNTTSASALTCALTGAAPADATGRGTGLNDELHAHKFAIVAQVLARHGSEDALEILRTMGGFEIAAMTGMALAAARHRLVLVVDGFISTAAAAIAFALAPEVRDFMVAGHRSQEPGHAVLLDYLGLTPVLTLELRLGEGTGAVLAMPIVEAALALYSQMATFTSANVSEADR